MKRNMWTKLVVVLVLVFTLLGCGKAEAPATTETTITTEVAAEVTALGEGATAFMFTVVDQDGNETLFAINTDKETVGEALLELELIKGEEGAYGLYVKEVNGIVADYDVTKTYWAFYVNGEYATSGVDTTKIEADTSYAFKVEK